MEEITTENKILIIVISTILLIFLIPAILFDNSIMIFINGGTSSPDLSISNTLMLIETKYIHYLFIAAFFILLLISIIAKDKTPILQEWRNILIVCLIAFAFEEPVTNILKVIIARPRPFDTLPLVWFLNPLTDAGGFSFPSGHSASGFCVITPLLLKFENRIYKILISLFGYLTAYARVYVGVHYPTDVIAGSLIGIGLGLLAYFVFDKFLVDKADERLAVFTIVVSLSIYGLIVVVLG
ncbi:MAG: phosphatase PAP2 family protein [Candidatus Helarchaeota archaeon]